MNFDPRWIYAAIALLGAFAVGAVLATIARRVLGAERRQPTTRAIASPTGTFLFWLSVAAGTVTALGFTSPETLRPIPSNVLNWLPGALAAGLIMLAAYAGGGAASAAAGATVERATGRRSRGFERAIRWVVLTAATVLALGNLGVKTTSLQILIAATAASAGAAFALLTALGGREVAANIASGRALRPELRVGAHLEGDGFDGELVAIRAAFVVVENDRGRTIVPLRSLLQKPFEVR